MYVSMFPIHDVSLKSVNLDFQKFWAVSWLLTYSVTLSEKNESECCA